MIVQNDARLIQKVCQENLIVTSFSDNGCGDYLVFKIVDGVCFDRVYWADHERSYELTKSDYEDFNTFVANVALRS